jgi:hypothetical protein
MGRGKALLQTQVNKACIIVCSIATGVQVCILAHFVLRINA